MDVKGFVLRYRIVEMRSHSSGELKMDKLAEQLLFLEKHLKCDRDVEMPLSVCTIVISHKAPAIGDALMSKKCLYLDSCRRWKGL